MGTFKDSLKKWFYTNSSSAASTDARIPLLTSTGDPKGSDTMENLASVLGALCVKGTILRGDLNDYFEQGKLYIYRVNSVDGAGSIQNSPISWGTYIVLYGGELAFGIANPKGNTGLYIRSGTSDSWHVITIA